MIALTSTRVLGGLLLKLCLVLFFFVYYQTVGIRGTLHSWVLVFGLAVTHPNIIIRRFVSSGSRLPLDYAIVGLLAVLVVLGFVVNLSSATVLQLQAYILSLAGYVVLLLGTGIALDRLIPLSTGG